MIKVAIRSIPDHFDSSIKGVDLQIRVPTLPSPSVITASIRALGYEPATGARPDSPGVLNDAQRGTTRVDPEVLRKRLYFARSHDPPTILHIRRMDSPFGWYTVFLRELLRADADERRRYEAIKRRLAAEHAADADYDDYTRAKTAFMDEVQPRLDAMASAAGLR